MGSRVLEYDPQSNAISSAYTAALNQYMRTDLKYGSDLTYKPGAYNDPDFTWDLRHQAPGGGPPATQQEGLAEGPAVGEFGEAQVNPVHALEGNLERIGVVCQFNDILA